MRTFHLLAALMAAAMLTTSNAGFEDGGAFAQSGGFPAPEAQTTPGGVPEAPRMRRTYAYLDGEDEELSRAIDYARFTLPRFVSIHASRHQAPERLESMVRAAVPTGAGGFEYRWLENIVIEPDASISGDLNTASESGAALAKGARVTAEPDAIVDWAVFTESGGIVGAYTTRVDVARADAETQSLYEGRFID